MKTVAKIGIVGLGNCASSLMQCIYGARVKQANIIDNLITKEIGGMGAGDLEITSVFDIDERKVGKPAGIAIWSEPNCTKLIYQHVDCKIEVSKGYRSDGISPHSDFYNETCKYDKYFKPIKTNETEEEAHNRIINILKNSGTEILVSYLPVGSAEASKFYAKCAIAAGCGYVNAIPEFLSVTMGEDFKKAGLPILGDDIKSQVGATIVHRTLVNLFKMRGMKIHRTYQLNTGGNMDFQNMLNRDRLESKKISKTQSVTSQYNLPANDVHVGPSDYVPWQNDNKICFIRIEGEHIGGIPIELELRLSVEDSPNSAGVMLDAIRLCKVALMNNLSGSIDDFSSFYFKSPRVQCEDHEAETKVYNALDKLGVRYTK